MLRKPKNPGSRRHLERTPAQEKAFRAFRLRALWHQAGLLTAGRAGTARDMIDLELRELGFEAEGDREAARIAEAKRLAGIPVTEIPW